MLFTCSPPSFPGNKLYFLRKTSICRGRVGGRASRLLTFSLLDLLQWPLLNPLPTITTIPILPLVSHYSMSLSPFLHVSREANMCLSSRHLLSSSLLVIHTWRAILLRRPDSDLLIITPLPALTLFGSNASFFFCTLKLATEIVNFIYFFCNHMYHTFRFIIFLFDLHEHLGTENSFCK